MPVSYCSRELIRRQLFSTATVKKSPRTVPGGYSLRTPSDALRARARPWKRPPSAALQMAVGTTHTGPNRTSPVTGGGARGRATTTLPASTELPLYQLYSNNTFRQKACSPTKVLKPGKGGRAQRTVARKACDNRTLTTWRNYVSVDVIGEVDTGGEPYNQDDVACRVP